MDGATERAERLYREYGPAIRGYIRRRLGDDDSAQDLLQETFVMAIRRAEQLARAASPRAWLFAVARNLCRSAVRRRRPLTGLPSQLAGEAERADPRVERMREAIAALPRRQREALELRLREDLTYEEIASVLGIPVGTVRSRLHHAVRRLRSRMADLED